MNHQCQQANLQAVKLFAEQRTFPTIAFVAARDISRGEELVVNYGQKQLPFECMCRFCTRRR